MVFHFDDLVDPLFWNELIFRLQLVDLIMKFICIFYFLEIDSHLPVDVLEEDGAAELKDQENHDLAAVELSFVPVDV